MALEREKERDNDFQSLLLYTATHQTPAENREGLDGRGVSSWVSVQLRPSCLVNRLREVHP